jgi:hypothetical protein
METVDRVKQWRQVADRYRSLTDDELIAIAQQRDDLTDVAQKALAAEMLHRNLEVPPEQKKPEPAEPPGLEPVLDSPYAEDRELVTFETVFSLRDAQQLEALLNEDGIPFYMGEERATRAADVTSDFAKGVPVGVMRIGWPYVTQAREYFAPRDDPDKRNWNEEDQRLEPARVFCPRCRAEKAVLDGTQPAPPVRGQVTRFLWRCDACGKRWEDDGVLATG